MQPIVINEFAGSYTPTKETKINCFSLDNSNWIIFGLRYQNKQYTGDAKVFNEPSHYGISNDDINGGRISKLTLKDNDGNLIFHYDRGWDVKTKGNQKLLNQLLKIFS